MRALRRRAVAPPGRGVRRVRQWARGRRGSAVVRVVRPVLVLAFWLVVWQAAALVVGQRLLLPAPAEVGARFGELVVEPAFWATVGHSLVRVLSGFVLGTVAGTVLAVTAARWSVVRALVTPLVGAVRAAPVVSFIILVLIWVDSGRLAVVVSALMVLPVVFAAVLEGIGRRDVAMLEVALVFRLPVWRRVRAIDVPAVLPFFAAACQVGIGLAWKSGIAAEVIGLPAGSVGERLYDAKLLLETADVFVWTGVVVALSLAAERGLGALLRRVPSARGAVAGGGARGRGGGAS
ncbi:binding-protein-dependent transport systems inner membrane component [Cellulomonas fimi ATCC 484]|uniref:Binding-protein-dependent transport systems inner membrane component n=1 Tax=Cellulomonas fimi (strain ATCC 484 / DSM 20113 / JCM 1341 / CCUG 24087 / LMG 16345 / NBRC 15513 / NCIMB 8980 / NCTC 7547 / NRS-133) TaxID=590998 RepID=F4H592_CELFA|nr:binding-protein-dependent transport systems inner membrane component [Cellulomonas fimi ATCC 484]VEH33917.1 Bicarbonate transport system permease protein CmpB [Cellulomonas fimi]